ncbi:MAG: hypothetical protein AAFY29_22885 [Pseudomonadota bacterium]
MTPFGKKDVSDGRRIADLESRAFDIERAQENLGSQISVANAKAKQVAPLRDQFAMAVITGLLTSEALISRHPSVDYAAEMVKKAYRIADLMLDERESGGRR